MKKILLVVMILLSFIIPLSAFTWQGVLDVNAAFTGPINELGLNQSNKLTMSFNAPLKTDVPMSFSGSGFYKLGINKELTTDAEIEISNILDITNLSYNVKVAGTAIELGRIPVMDVTGLILNQPLDGTKVTYGSNNFSISSFVGFTGFLNSHSVSINAAANENGQSEIYALASPFVLMNAMVRAPQLFAGQDLFAEVFAAIDVAGTDTPSNRIYTNVVLSGPIADVVYYTFGTSVGVMQNDESKWGFSNLSSFELSGFLPFASTMISWKTVFATSDKTGNFETFTSSTGSMDGSIPYAGHIKTGVLTTMRPHETVLLMLAPDVLFNVMSEDSDKGYAGFQWNFTAKYSPFSDFDMLASIGQFYAAEKGSKPYLNASIGLSFRF